LRSAARQHEDQLQRTRDFEDSIRTMLESPETMRWAIRVWHAAPGNQPDFANTLLVDKAWAVILGRDIADAVAKGPYNPEVRS
jgi:hypothetical protein